MPKTYDIAVLGATPAGYAAAVTLARKRRAVVLLKCPAAHTESPLADWAPAETFRACPAMRSVRRAGTDASFRAVLFHSPQLDRQAAYRQRSTAGFFLRRHRLLKALAGEARRAGVRLVALADEAKPELAEAAVVLAGKRPVRARLLLIAQDGPAEAMAKVKLAAEAVPAGRLTIWGLDVPLGSGRRRNPIDNALHVITFERADRLGMFFRAGDVLHFRIIFNQPRARPGAGGLARTPASAPTGGPDALAQLIGALRQAALLPAKLNLAKASAAMWRPPGGVALEMETHLAKRTLLVGTAGGFAASLTGQTLAPTVRSALVAADVANRALRGRDLQDTLAEYKRRWRDPLADTIRPLRTSLQMLTPMVFTNKAMAGRFARAILYGENI